MSDVLVLYYSRAGSTEKLAREVCRGVDSVTGMTARLRTVPAVSAIHEATEAEVPDAGPPYATTQDLVECAGVVMGSPTRFGNMDASLKYFIDGTVGEWFKGALEGKPAGVFASTSSLHGGQAFANGVAAAVGVETAHAAQRFHTKVANFFLHYWRSQILN